MTVKEVKVKAYVADDGTPFASEEACRAHEENKKILFRTFERDRAAVLCRLNFLKASALPRAYRQWRNAMTSLSVEIRRRHKRSEWLEAIGAAFDKARATRDEYTRFLCEFRKKRDEFKDINAKIQRWLDEHQEVAK